MKTTSKKPRGNSSAVKGEISLSTINSSSGQIPRLITRTFVTFRESLLDEEDETPKLKAESFI